jgi:hypothetical protein
VELWARESGRHAKLHFTPGGTWFVRISLKSDDPRMELYKLGLVEEPVGEDVWLHLPNAEEGKVINGEKQGPFIPLSLTDLGTSGLREFLERGDTWSGRGEYMSLLEQRRKVNESNEGMRVKNRAFQKEENRHEMRQSRRRRLKIPFLRPKGGWLNLRAPKDQKKEQ